MAINYTPPPTVRSFILHHEPARLFFDWILGPVGSGKTTGNFFKLIYMMGMQDRSPIDGIRRTRCIVVRNTAPQLKDTTIKSWNYWFRDGQAGKWYATDKNFVLRFKDMECEVMFRPLDTPDDISRVLSLETTFAIVDEYVEVPMEIIDALGSRCGRYPPPLEGGATNWGMWGSSNAGNEDSEWHEKFYESLPSNWKVFTQPSGLSPFAENLENLPGKARYYTDLIIGKSENWINQFVRVIWGYSLSGKPVVPTFKHELHVVKADPQIHPSTYYPLVLGLDPGLNIAVIIMQMSLNGRLTVFDTLYEENMGAERFIKNVLKPFLRMKYPEHDYVIAPDPAAYNRKDTDEKSVVDVFKMAGFEVEVPDLNNQLPPRLEAIEYFTTRITMEGPALRIVDNDTNKVLIRALSGGWKYKIQASGNESPQPEKNKASHPGDAFGYGCKHYHAPLRKDEARRKKPLPVQTRNNPYAVS